MCNIYIAGIIQTNIEIKQISKRLKLKSFLFFAITCYFDDSIRLGVDITIPQKSYLQKRHTRAIASDNSMISLISACIICPLKKLLGQIAIDNDFISQLISEVLPELTYKLYYTFFLGSFH